MKKSAVKSGSFPAEKTANWPTKIGKASKNLNKTGYPKVKQSAKTTL